MISQEEIEQGITVQTLLSSVAASINRDEVLRINVTRNAIWAGTVHAFKRRTYDASKQMMICFADSEGTPEGAID